MGKLIMKSAITFKIDLLSDAYARRRRLLAELKFVLDAEYTDHKLHLAL